MVQPLPRWTLWRPVGSFSRTVVPGSAALPPTTNAPSSALTEVTVPVSRSRPFSTNTSPAITSPAAVRLAWTVAKPAVPAHWSAAASPLSPRSVHACGAVANSCESVIRFAGRSSSRLRGSTTDWPPTRSQPPDQTSPGVVRVSCSTGPDRTATDGAVTVAAPAPVGSSTAASSAAHSAASSRPRAEGRHDRAGRPSAEFLTMPTPC